MIKPWDYILSHVKIIFLHRLKAFMLGILMRASTAMMLLQWGTVWVSSHWSLLIWMSFCRQFQTPLPLETTLLSYLQGSWSGSCLAFQLLLIVYPATLITTCPRKCLPSQQQWVISMRVHASWVYVIMISLKPNLPACRCLLEWYLTVKWLTKNWWKFCNSCKSMFLFKWMVTKRSVCWLGISSLLNV